MQAYNLKLLDRLAGNIDSLRIGPRIGRGEKDSGSFHKSSVVGGQALQFLSIAERHPQPDTGGAWPDGEVLAYQPFRIGGVRRRSRKIANIADPLDLFPAHAENLPAQVENLKPGGLLPQGGARIARAPVARKLSHDHGFAKRGHCSGLSHDSRGRE